MTASLTIVWVDERLAYKENCTEGVQLNLRDLESLWVPTEIRKSTSGIKHAVPEIQVDDPRQTYNYENIYWERNLNWYMNGTIEMFASLRGQHESCYLNFKWFPFDKQECKFMVYKLGKQKILYLYYLIFHFLNCLIRGWWTNRIEMGKSLGKF